MTLKDIQKDVDDWTGQYTPQYWPPHEILTRMAEEVGELAREVNHSFGTKKKKDSEAENSIDKELIDIMFTIVCMANSQGIDLQKEWDKMVNEKLYKRDKDRFERKE